MATIYSVSNIGRAAERKLHKFVKSVHMSTTSKIYISTVTFFVVSVGHIVIDVQAFVVGGFQNTSLIFSLNPRFFLNFLK